MIVVAVAEIDAHTQTTPIAMGHEEIQRIFMRGHLGFPWGEHCSRTAGIGIVLRMDRNASGDGRQRPGDHGVRPAWYPRRWRTASSGRDGIATSIVRYPPRETGFAGA